METFFDNETKRVVFTAERAVVRAAVKKDSVDIETTEQSKVL